MQDTEKTALLNLLKKQWNSSEDFDSIKRADTNKYRWKCEKGHEWEASKHQRFYKRTGCPYCAGLRIIPGETSIISRKPELKSEWDYEKNETDPETVGPKSQIKFWWKCSDGHSWLSTPSTRWSGSGCPVCSGRVVDPGKTSLADLYPSLRDEWNDQKSPSDYRPGSKSRIKWKCNQGHTWIATIKDRVKGSGCPKCSNQVSKSEDEVAEFLRSFCHVERSTKKVISPYELDIYIPEMKLAVEFNGLYWHSTEYRDKMYHRNKYEACRDKGIQLIMIWEDDWRDRQNIVKSMLKHKIGVSDKKRVPARKTNVKKISKQEADKFLSDHHIQGFSSGTYYLGLEHENKLVAVSVFKRTHRILELIRFSTSCVVSGGQSKIISWVDKNIDYDKMITFADLAVSDGTLYEKSGWIKDKELRPDYKYVVGGHRKHKFGYRKKRFELDPDLRFEEGKTELELASMNNLHRIYDCGKIRYTRFRMTEKG